MKERRERNRFKKKKKKGQQKESQSRIRGLACDGCRLGFLTQRPSLIGRCSLQCWRPGYSTSPPKPCRAAGLFTRAGLARCSALSLWSKLLVVHMRRKQIGNAVLRWRNWRWCPTFFGGSGILNTKAENHHNFQQHERDKSQICFVSIMNRNVYWFPVITVNNETPVILE